MTAEQRRAADLACKNSISVITGAAGTGKSLLIREIIARSRHHRWIVLAPTWKALASLTAALGDMEQPVERLTVARFNLLVQGRLPDGKKLDDFRREHFGSEYSVVVDEVGILDARTFRLLLGSTKYVQRLILVGDPHQLPSIGPGAVLRDLESCKRIPHAHLKEVHRTSSDSGIASLSANLLIGRFEPGGPGVRVRDVARKSEIIEATKDQYQRTRQRCGPLDVQIIASVNRLCDQLNSELQVLCNRRGEQVHEKLRVRDPFIATKHIRGVLVKGETGQVMLYSAVTRARETLTFIGPKSGARKAAQYYAAQGRQTLLAHYLRKLMPPVPDGDAT